MIVEPEIYENGDVVIARYKYNDSTHYSITVQNFAQLSLTQKSFDNLSELVYWLKLEEDSNV